ncbi:MAG: chalcone isomerase family protein [Halothiobacillaceae bacterium]|nr:chalcone isomerase family protein [Halothiobacillaceae bacterium]
MYPTSPQPQRTFKHLLPSIAVLALSLISGAASNAAEQSSPPQIASQIQLGKSDLPLMGTGVATYLWFDVYDAALYAPARTPAATILNATTPKALVLSYHHAVSVADIVKASWKALDEQYTGAARARLKPKIDALQAAMQDVKPGDRYELTWQPATNEGASPQQATLQLIYNGKSLFMSHDAELAQAYFGIWLGEPPLSPKLKTALLATQ